MQPLLTIDQPLERFIFDGVNNQTKQNVTDNIGLKQAYQFIMVVDDGGRYTFLCVPPSIPMASYRESPHRQRHLINTELSILFKSYIPVRLFIYLFIYPPFHKDRAFVKTSIKRTGKYSRKGISSVEKPEPKITKPSTHCDQETKTTENGWSHQRMNEYLLIYERFLYNFSIISISI